MEPSLTPGRAKQQYPGGREGPEPVSDIGVLQSRRVGEVRRRKAPPDADTRHIPISQAPAFIGLGNQAFRDARLIQRMEGAVRG